MFEIAQSWLSLMRNEERRLLPSYTEMMLSRDVLLDRTSVKDEGYVVFCLECIFEFFCVVHCTRITYMYMYIYCVSRESTDSMIYAACSHLTSRIPKQSNELRCRR